ncbi:MAG: hypothetical protein RL563_1107 [Pseudomonadota bacterium]|jgi:hypothetical protein
MTVIVPERKVWSRQPPNTSATSKVSNGLVFAYTPTAGRMNLVTGAPLSVIGTVSDRASVNGLGLNTTASADVLYSSGTLNIPASSGVSFAVVAEVDNNSVTRKRAIRLSNPTNGTIFLLDFSTSAVAPVSVAIQDTAAVFGFREQSSYNAKQLYIVVATHAPGQINPMMWVNGILGAQLPVNCNGTRMGTITDIYLGNNNSAAPLTGKLYSAAVWNRDLDIAEVKSISENPWQIFAPRRQLFYFSNTGQIDLTANATSVATSSGTLDLAQSLSAQAAALASVNGDITQTTPLAGDAFSSASVSGTLSTSGGLTVDLASNAQAAATAAGALYSAMALLGSASSASTATGAIVDKTPPLAGAAVASATASATFYSEPKPVPAYRYAPGIAPTELLPLVTFIMTELYNIKSALDSVADGHLDKVYLPPTKPTIGDIRYADGSTWNPGSGQGIYYYNGSIWKLLG